ncbi:hypothetical protein Nepgr_007662 [Nepenthes gracilis]|uniref:Protein kinase domain-containing protein n=1 Tax=Nepenthes gracilis TaxID=150966 RepID=A0AAD3S873_NEPGR|nr:hypothetical protein Nepgr_007662 [Nepenthes gracilis]
MRPRGLRSAMGDSNLGKYVVTTSFCPIFQSNGRERTSSPKKRLLQRDLQKATQNFTTLIGHGAFGPVYKAQMVIGETVTVKVLATDSKQGEREFQTEVKPLGRLYHRNLLNLVGYCAKKGKNILIYVYMSNGSLSSHLYYNDECRRRIRLGRDGGFLSRGQISREELNEVAALAYRCIDRSLKKRPSMRDIVRVLSQILKSRQSRKHHRKSLAATREEELVIDIQNSVSEDLRVKSMDSSMAETDA